MRGLYRTPFILTFFKLMYKNLIAYGRNLQIWADQTHPRDLPVMYTQQKKNSLA